MREERGGKEVKEESRSHPETAGRCQKCRSRGTHLTAM